MKNLLLFLFVGISSLSYSQLQHFISVHTGAGISKMVYLDYDNNPMSSNDVEYSELSYAQSTTTNYELYFNSFLGVEAELGYTLYM